MCVSMYIFASSMAKQSFLPRVVMCVCICVHVYVCMRGEVYACE